ncbi:MAG: hypothetical protein Q8O04_07600 [Deltaproteobacteria bacterium]|nr:hypothetical protein [Deltaproteobacteria bacterium]
MPVQVEVHSTAKRAVFIIGFALVLVAALVGLQKLSERPNQDSAKLANAVGIQLGTYIAPVVNLNVDPQSKETVWSAALAETLRGKTEVPVQNGRVDVLTDKYAIEVERLEKWHEGIGQSTHYAIETSKIPCLAIIIEPKDIPLSGATVDKLYLIEKIALKSGIKLIFLVAVASET